MLVHTRDLEIGKLYRLKQPHLIFWFFGEFCWLYTGDCILVLSQNFDGKYLQSLNCLSSHGKIIIHNLNDKNEPWELIA